MKSKRHKVRNSRRRHDWDLPDGEVLIGQDLYRLSSGFSRQKFMFGWLGLSGVELVEVITLECIPGDRWTWSRGQWDPGPRSVEPPREDGVSMTLISLVLS